MSEGGGRRTDYPEDQEEWDGARGEERQEGLEGEAAREHAQPVEHPEDDESGASECAVEGQLEGAREERVEELRGKRGLRGGGAVRAGQRTDMEKYTRKDVVKRTRIIDPRVRFRSNPEASRAEAPTMTMKNWCGRSGINA